MKVSRVLLSVLMLLALLSPLGCSCQGPPPAALINGTSLVARAAGRYFEAYEGGRWKRIVVEGANIGASTPGHWFGELSGTKKLFRQWFEQISEMNADTVRVYTLLNPEFYEALNEFNRANEEHRLWLLQEIWPPDTIPGDNLFDSKYEADYHREIKLDIDALMGQADITERKGRAWGKFKVNIFPYLLGILVGREITYEEAKATNDANRDRAGYDGRYVRTTGDANPVESWLAQATDYTESYAEEKYSWQVPVGFVSWPTLDPMVHPTELTPGGAKEDEVDDSQALNPAHLVAGPDAKAGLFGAYHIYPYYPDFMYREPGYAQYSDEQGVLRYGGYLRQFMSIHPDYPAVVAEFGIPTSLVAAHIHPEGFGHGGVDEKQQGVMIARMMRAILKEGYAGGVIFEWADEWAKRTWSTMPYMIPFERHILWHNMMDPEQNFGILADDSNHKPFGGKERLLWRAAKAGGKATGSGGVSALYADADEAYLYLAVEFAGGEGAALRPDTPGDLALAIGISTLGPDRGTVKLPVGGLPDLPAGAEFLLQLSGSAGGSILARPDYNRGTSRFIAAPATDSDFEQITWVSNRQQVSQADGTVFPPIYTNESVLHYGVFQPADKRYDSLAHWYVADSGKKVYIRLPWMLLNVSDPSSNTVLRDDRTNLPPGPTGLRDNYGLDALGTVKTPGFLFFVAATRAGAPVDYQPRAGNAFRVDAKPYLWPGWDKPGYSGRLKQSYPEIKNLFK